MKQLDLKKIWEISKILHEYDLLGFNTVEDFDYFISRYSFKVDLNTLTYFNADPVPYEDYTEEDFNTFPITLLTSTLEEVKAWADQKELDMEKQMKQSYINEREMLEMRIKNLDRIIHANK